MFIDEIVNFDYIILVRIVVAALLGGVIGFERSISGHSAGLRTHILLCMGAATVMALSEILVKKYNCPNEILRMGAQVISGVGFLGAGSIILDGNRVQGMTTAAGVWSTACLGLVVGSGEYMLAIAATAIMLLALVGFHSLSNRVEEKAKTIKIRISFTDRNDINEVMKRFEELNLNVRKFSLVYRDGDTEAIAVIKPKNGMTVQTLICDLSGYDCVVGIEKN
ncbi:MAG: MgtC/SapB family protein [Clostridiales bacterium]|nr:MgtC/SapB family protein [Clostridiales bacterium]